MKVIRAKFVRAGGAMLGAEILNVMQIGKIESGAVEAMCEMAMLLT